MTDDELLKLAKEGVAYYEDSVAERLIFERLLTALPEIERLRAEVAALRANQPLELTDDDGDGYVCLGTEQAVVLQPADLLALQTLSGGWRNAMSYVRLRVKRGDDRDSIEGWWDEFQSAVQKLARLSDRIDAARAT